MHAVLRERGVMSVTLLGSVAPREARLSSDNDIRIDVNPEPRFRLFDLVDVKPLLEHHPAQGLALSQHIARTRLTAGPLQRLRPADHAHGGDADDVVPHERHVRKERNRHDSL